MCKDGQDILWTHVRELYKNDRDQPLHLPNKITRAHVELDSYSKVNLKNQSSHTYLMSDEY